MKPVQYSASCERIVAEAMRPVASELRLIDAGDLIALLRFERRNELSDLVASAAELYFMPGTIAYSGGDFSLDWGGDPEILLDLELRTRDLTVFTKLTLREEVCGVEIGHIDWRSRAPNAGDVEARLHDSICEQRYVTRAA